MVTTLLLLNASYSNAAEVLQNQIVFTDITVVTQDLQKFKQLKEENSILEEKIKLLEEQASNYEKNINILEEQNKLLTTKIEKMEEFIKLEDATIDRFESLIKRQKEAYETVLESTKPSFWQSAKEIIGFIGIGIAIGVGVTLL